MGIVTLLLLIGAACTGIASVIKVINNMKKDDSPAIGPGFLDAFKEMFKHED